jgi:outer membrane protein assembly factor BamB
MALAVVLAVTVSVGCQAMGYQAAPVALTFSPYDSSASWPSIHGGPYNADFGRNDPADELEPAWTTLGGTAMLTAPIIDDARGRFYLVSGRRRAPNLLAYRLNGTREHLEWTSLPPQLGGPGPGALASSPILDEDGNLYISDGEWFWSFSGEDGSVRWQAPMPAEEQGGEIIHPPFITAFFLPTGEVGGVTSVGKVLIYCREDGELLAEHQIEGAFSSTALDVPEFVLQLLDDCLWLTENGRFMIQDDIRLRYLGGFLGTGMAVTNTPAVIRRGGAGEPSASIYVPVMLEHTDEDGNHDVRLVRIDTWGRGHSLHLAEFGPQQGFSGLIPGGAGSATSPTANEDMSKMYIAAEDGYIYSVDTDTGAVARLEERIGHVLGSLSYDWSPQGAPLLYVGSGSKIFAIDAAAEVFTASNLISRRLRQQDLRHRRRPERHPVGAGLHRLRRRLPRSARRRYAAHRLDQRHRHVQRQPTARPHHHRIPVRPGRIGGQVHLAGTLVPLRAEQAGRARRRAAGAAGCRGDRRRRRRQRARADQQGIHHELAGPLHVGACRTLLRFPRHARTPEPPGRNHGPAPQEQLTIRLPQESIM